MTKTSRVLLGGSLFLIVASMGTCFFGIRYAISRIPPDELARRGDTDWIGVEWVLRGGILLLVAIFLALIPPVLWLFRRITSNEVPPASLSNIEKSSPGRQ